MSVVVGEAIQVGAHRMVCEPDLFSITFVGDLRADDMRQFHAVNMRYYKQHGYLMCLGDARKVGTMTSECRKLTAQLSREHICPGATAIFGAGLLARTLATLVMKAIALTAGTQSEYAFFKTEAEARAWLDEQRPRLIAARISS